MSQNCCFYITYSDFGSWKVFLKTKSERDPLLWIYRWEPYSPYPKRHLQLIVQLNVKWVTLFFYPFLDTTSNTTEILFLFDERHQLQLEVKVSFLRFFLLFDPIYNPHREIDHLEKYYGVYYLQTPSKSQVTNIFHFK